MNYLKLINQFWQLRRSKRITNLQADLYYFLMQECNLRNWENPFQVPNGLICVGIGITEKSLIDARNVLKQIGLIDFEPGITKRKAPVYYLLDYSIEVSNPVGNQGGNPVSNPVGNGGNISIKLNQTKPDKEGVPAKPPPPKNSGKNEKEPEPFWEVLVKIWFDFNFEKFKEKPSFSDADPRYLKKIIEKLKKRAALKKVDWNEITAPERLRTFLLKAYEDDWLCKHFLLRNLNEQFDTVIMKHRAASASNKSEKINGSSGPKGFEQELQYLSCRYVEGDLDQRLITKDLYDKMVSRNVLPTGHFKKFPGNTMELQMTNAVLDYFKTRNDKAKAATA